MTDLRELSRAVQRAEFPSHEFAAAVREWIAAATEVMEPASDPAKVCGSCGENVSSLSDHITCPETGEYYCQPTSEPARVECPNCGAAVEQPWAHYPGGWRCPTLPAQPEAPGLLEAVQRISDSIGWRSTQGDDPTLYYCEFCSEAHPDWRNVPHHDECPVFVIRAAIAKATTPMSNKPAQPKPAPAVAMTPELERVLEWARLWSTEYPPSKEQDELLTTIAAVRAQASQPQRVELGKVRALLESRPRNYPNLEYDAAIAELNAAEGVETKEGK